MRIPLTNYNNRQGSGVDKSITHISISCINFILDKQSTDLDFANLALSDSSDSGSVTGQQRVEKETSQGAGVVRG